MSAAKEGEDLELPRYDWDTIAGSTKGTLSGISTLLNLNSGMESFVKKFKGTLKHKFASRLMLLRFHAPWEMFILSNFHRWGIFLKPGDFFEVGDFF